MNILIKICDIKSKEEKPEPWNPPISPIPEWKI